MQNIPTHSTKCRIFLKTAELPNLQNLNQTAEFTAEFPQIMQNFHKLCRITTNYAELRHMIIKWYKILQIYKYRQFNNTDVLVANSLVL